MFSQTNCRHCISGINKSKRLELGQTSTSGLARWRVWRLCKWVLAEQGMSGSSLFSAASNIWSRPCFLAAFFFLTLSLNGKLFAIYWPSQIWYPRMTVYSSPWLERIIRTSLWTNLEGDITTETGTARFAGEKFLCCWLIDPNLLDREAWTHLQKNPDS